MKHQLAITSIGIAIIVGLTACAEESSTGGSAASSSPRSSSSATPATGEHNDADVAFAQGMIPHHAQAIDMSDIVLAKDGLDPAVQELAREIKGAQGPEMEQMEGWLIGWGEDVPEAGTGSMDGMDGGDMDHSGMSGMSGLMSEEDMTRLEDSSGQETSRLFLEQMIMHHRGAIAMAEQELDAGVNPDAQELAREIIETQRSEITAMSELLAG